MEKIELQEVEIMDEDTISSKQIVLYNDDFNTFDNVIKCLMVYCKHVYEQALQFAMQVHEKGRCSVKEGSYKELKPICEALLEKGLSAQIE
jgi:ATP-dependent Clp protease adaptor protein ClpS